MIQCNNFSSQCVCMCVLQMLLSVPQDSVAHMRTHTALVTLHTPCALHDLCVQQPDAGDLAQHTHKTTIYTTDICVIKVGSAA